ncbi:class A beta-lactamase-related serine hydrolase [Chitinophaga nivalis]|uniref:Class A beta-lactamase-related serine hydrolase n=1 Tax=Chitinophaga nivalis TaxID=2991709 RepID=A0ABT3IIV1_9BACT|nr:class A beta-lactamase-related serine hydrolase [Chitinophaga nivalis]MCW3466417.1 class A beta-lactamase-related serine hydrolase [Chitinophaga nivalis]MCW3483892.1 class A beta-lactamase-related serine hydrolase [Chitinophaga nivalis]
MKWLKTAWWITMLLATHVAFAQESTTSPIFIALQRGDSILFEEGFNKCNLAALEGLLVPDFEFYHDQNGAQNKAEFLKGFKESICSNTNQKPIRKLVQGSLVVYPLKNEGKIYGAIQMGIHDFYIAEPGKALRFTENARFIATWVLDGGSWKIKRELSYNHNKPKRYGVRFDDNYPFPLFDTDAGITWLLKAFKIPSVSIGYINHGKLQQISAFGEQQPGVAIAANSIYKVASLTKPITALVVLKLIEAGKWKLDEPVAHYYVDPALKDNPWLLKLTTRYILSQQSGFPNWRYLRADKKLVFEFEPGTKFQYSGEGFEYLRKAIEKKFKKPLAQLANEWLFSPLKMEDTYYYWTKATDESRYAVESDTMGQPLKYEKYYTANAAANLLTTVADYSKCLVHILDSAGLSPKLYQEFITPQSTVKAGVSWGLGMQVFPDLPGQEFALQHTGGDEGTKCIALLLPKSKRGLIIFINGENGLVIWKKIIEEYLGEAGKEIVRRNLE